MLVTTTRYSSVTELRCTLAVKTVIAARENGYPIIVVDSSSDENVKKILSDNEAIVLEGNPGMGEQRRMAFRAALEWESAKSDVIVWLEPEKYPLVPLLAPAIRSMAEGNSELVVVGRTSMGSYHVYQASSEILLNTSLAAITGRADLDLSFGPRVMNRMMARNYFLRYEGRYGDNWQIIFVPVIQALANGCKVISMRVGYTHPAKQAEQENTDEFDHKRDRQRIDLISAMAQAAQDMGYYPNISKWPTFVQEAFRAVL